MKAFILTFLLLVAVVTAGSNIDHNILSTLSSIHTQGAEEIPIDKLSYLAGYATADADQATTLSKQADLASAFSSLMASTNNANSGLDTTELLTILASIQAGKKSNTLSVQAPQSFVEESDDHAVLMSIHEALAYQPGTLTPEEAEKLSPLEAIEQLAIEAKYLETLQDKFEEANERVNKAFEGLKQANANLADAQTDLANLSQKH